MSCSTKMAVCAFLLILLVAYIPTSSAEDIDYQALAKELTSNLAKGFNEGRRTADIKKVLDLISRKFQFQLCQVRLDHDYSIVYMLPMLANKEDTKPFKITVKEADWRGYDLSVIAHVEGSVFDDDMILDFEEENGKWKFVFGTILTCEYD